MLNNSDTQHQETVAATMKPEPGPDVVGPSLAVVKPPEVAQKTDLQLAKEATALGKSVELNDDNQIVDKRELLSAGLNLSAPNTRRLGRPTPKATDTDAQMQAHRAVGTAASRKEINERRAREVQQQLKQEDERVVEEREREERERLQRIVAKRNQDDDIQNARERYLARKRRKLESAEDTETEVAV
jgi:coiled-coil domain-containing protein 55